MICNLGTELDLVWAVKGPSNLSYPWEIPAFLCLLELKGRVVASEPSSGFTVWDVSGQGGR